MLENKGDIIASDGAYFGASDGKIQTPEPKRFTMLAKNCITNSTLFKKADWQKAGGYDKAFDKGFEDYDFWLNLVIYQKCKIYRVPEILFYYRIKDISESRNKQASKIRAELCAKLNHKYPFRRTACALFYFWHLPSKIIRIFYKKKNKNGIKYHRIFGICVYKQKLLKE